MKKKKKGHDSRQNLAFSEFISDPIITLSLVTFAMIALFLSILEFSQTLSSF